MKIYALNVKSESGDEFGPYLFKEEDKPKTNEEILKFLREKVSPCDCEEYNPDEDGCPGWMGTYLHLSWSDHEV